MAPNVCTCISDGWGGTNCATPMCPSGCAHGICTSPYTCTCQSVTNITLSLILLLPITSERTNFTKYRVIQDQCAPICYVHHHVDMEFAQVVHVYVKLDGNRTWLVVHVISRFVHHHVHHQPTVPVSHPTYVNVSMDIKVREEEKSRFSRLTLFLLDWVHRYSMYHTCLPWL
jgi:hypothetical protein